MFSPASFVRGNAFAHESGMRQVGIIALSINKDAVFVSLLLTYLIGVYVASTCYLVLVHICKSAVIISSPVEFYSQ